MTMPFMVHDTRNWREQAGHDRAAAGLATDHHAKRIILDLAEWYDRLARLAEMRAAQPEQ
jgi:hypothetical protein